MSVREAIEPFLSWFKEAPPDELAARCPFHDDRDPSFYINTNTGLFFCHGCGARGNLRSFLLGMGVSREELRLKYRSVLKAAANSEEPELDPTKVTIEAPLNRRIPSSILGLFDALPAKLLDAGFEERTLKHFHVGFDKKHERITFPLWDIKGNLVGISGRAMQDGYRPRYKIYGESEYPNWGLPVYRTDKSLILWNGQHVYPRAYASPDPQPVILVEGFKACMWVWQAGFKDVVALIGSKLSKAQGTLLKRMGAECVLMLDNNEAGSLGALELAEALTGPLKVRIASYDKEQPDLLTKTETQEAIINSREIHELLLS